MLCVCVSNPYGSNPSNLAALFEISGRNCSAQKQRQKKCSQGGSRYICNYIHIDHVYIYIYTCIYIYTYIHVLSLTKLYMLHQVLPSAEVLAVCWNCTVNELELVGVWLIIKKLSTQRVPGRLPKKKTGLSFESRGIGGRETGQLWNSMDWCTEPSTTPPGGPYFLNCLDMFCALILKLQLTLLNPVQSRRFLLWSHEWRSFIARTAPPENIVNI